MWDLEEEEEDQEKGEEEDQSEIPCFLAIFKSTFSLSLDYKVSDVQYQLILDVLRLLKHAIMSH